MDEDKNSGGVLDFMRDVLTLGFLSSNQEQKDKPSEHFETCQVIIKKKKKNQQFLKTYKSRV